MRTRMCNAVCGVPSIQDATHNENGKPIWKCRCCGTKTPRKVYNTKARAIKLAKRERICAMVEELMGGHQA